MRAAQRFCSRVCAALAQRRLFARLCVVCSREFIPARASQTFCSTRCALIGRAPAVRPCTQCVTQFTMRSASQRFCSPRCANKWQREHPLSQVSPPLQKCEVCETSFPAQGRKRRFCSRSCLLAALRKRNRRRCELCSSEFGFVDGRRRFCSKKCAVLGSRRNRADRAYNWKGGRTLAARDYVKVRAPDHPRASKKHPYVLEHILVMERVLGRYLLPNEHVHHRNGRRDDNRPENLELWKGKHPHGVRAADYHCPVCRCDPRSAVYETLPSDGLAEKRGRWRGSTAA